MKQLKLTLIILSLFAFIMPVSAEESEKVFVTVNGLVCDFCARALEKTFGERDDLESIKVDLDTKLVSLLFNKKDAMSDEELKTLIVDSGYDVVKIERGEQP